MNVLPDQSHPTNPVKAIRAYCLECCKESQQEVKLCPATECQLHPFRMGKNPYRKPRTLTEEQKQALTKGRDMFNIAKSSLIESENEFISHGSINSHLSTESDESIVNSGRYPVYDSFPEEGWD